MNRMAWDRAALGALLAALGLGCSDGGEGATAASGAAIGAAALDAALAVTSRWPGGLCAAVTLTNRGAGAVTGWTATVDLDGARLTNAWNAEAAATDEGFAATALPYDARIAPGGSVAFGFCAAGAGVPLVTAAEAQPASDFGADVTASLRVDADWPAGYCATVEVRNDTGARLWTWGVVIDLNASSLTNAWNAEATVDGGRLTARPEPYDAVLDPGASERFGFCAAKTGPDWRPSLAPAAEPEDPGKRFTVAVYLPRRVDTCYVGNPCPAGDATCVGLRDDQGNLAEAFTEASLRAVPPDWPYAENQRVCVELVMSPAERDAVVAELELYRDQVREWSRGDIELDLRLIEFDDPLPLFESRWGQSVWIAPGDLAAFALPRLDFVPDFNLVVPPVRDPVQGLHQDLPACGGSFGADYGLAGAGWSWVPTTASSYWFECANASVFTHEWLHQVEYAYEHLSGFDDAYGDALPACGQAAPDPKRWFPAVHACTRDPDFMACGWNDCGDPDRYYQHILSEHWDPSVAFVANYCEDGVQDFDETAVDAGPTCRDAAAGEGVPAAAPTP